jgi:hypothetical protein
MQPVKPTQQLVACAAAAFRKWCEGKGALYGETLQTTGFHVGRIVIVPREFAPMPSPPLRASENRGMPGMRFSGMTESIGPMCSPHKKHVKTGGGVPPPVGRPRAPVQGRDGRRAPYPSSAMSSGRLFLDRVARQQSPSPLHRQPELNTRPAEPWDKGDISTLRKRGHFYFALTCATGPLARWFTFRYD